MKLIIRHGILHFHDTAKPKAVGKKPPAYSITVIGDPGRTTVKYKNKAGEKKEIPIMKMQDLCDAIAKDYFNGKVPVKLKNWAWNKADGSTTREEYVDKEGDYYDGMDEGEAWFVSAKKDAEDAPEGIPCLNQLREDLNPNSPKLYPGCIVNVIVDVFAFSHDEGDCISARYEGIQLVGDGPQRFKLGTGGSINAREEFEDEEIPEGEEVGSGASDLL